MTMQDEGIIEELCPSMYYRVYRILQPEKLHPWFLDIIRNRKQKEDEQKQMLENFRLTLLEHCTDPLIRALVS